MRYFDLWLAGPRRGASRLRGLGLRAASAVIIEWGLVLLGLLMAQGLGSVVTVVIARRVAPFDFGQYLSCVSLVSVLLVFPTLGLDNWLLAQGDAGPPRLGELWHSALRSRLRLLGVWLAAIAGLAFVLPAGTYPAQVLLPTAILVGAQSVVALAYSALRLIGQHRRITLLQSIFAVAALAIALLMPLVANRLVFFAVGTALVAVATAITVVVQAGRLFQESGAKVPLRTLFKGSRPFMVSDIAVMIYSRATLTLISLILGAAGAAVFGPADGLITATFWVPTALYVLVLPLLSRAHASGGRRDFYQFGLAQLLLQAATGLALSLALFFLTPLLIRLIFGSAYDAAIPILQLTSPIPFFKSLNFGLGAWLTSSRRQTDRTWVQIVVAGFTVVAGVWAISAWGLAGAAVVEVANESLLSLGYALFVARRWRQAD